MKKKPRLGISACLLGHAVRYDGRDKYDPLLVERLAEFIEWVPVCPEVEFGFPVPRESIRLEGDREAPALRGVFSLQDHTVAMREFCRCRVAALGLLGGFVFKSKSPSCGLAAPVYTNDAATGTAAGIFAAAWLAAHPGLPAIEAELLHDETRLHEFLALLQ